jgi:hypothetical protein
MSDPVRWTGQMPSTRQQQQQQQPASNDGTNLADILERVLDKGIVIAGDIQINLLDIELLTIKLRLVVASVDKAKEMGIDWWERDPTLSSGHRELEDENQRLRQRLEALEGTAGALAGGKGAGAESADEVDAEVEDDEVEDAANDDEAADESADVEEPEPEPAAPRRRKSPTRSATSRSAASQERPRKPRS